MSDILQLLEQLNGKELMQISLEEESQRQTEVWPKKYRLAPFLKKRRSVCANLFYQKVFNRNPASAKTWPTKARNSETLWPCSVTKGSWANKLSEWDYYYFTFQYFVVSHQETMSHFLLIGIFVFWVLIENKELKQKERTLNILHYQELLKSAFK